jgi:Domain of unknown function (DUF4956)
VSELMPFLEPGAALKLDSLITFMIVGSLCAGVVAYVYTLISPKKADEAEFAATLFLLTIAIGLLVSIIKQAPAISFGLFGAMSIVRFRAQIKKSRRMVFLFMATVIGVCSGAGEYIATVFGTLVLAGVSYVMFGPYIEKADECEQPDADANQPTAAEPIVPTPPTAQIVATLPTAAVVSIASVETAGAITPDTSDMPENAARVYSNRRK